jgi:transcriptional regulator with XRE-family HTH domain
MENNITIQKDYTQEVDRGCTGQINCIFETLFLRKKAKQQDLADFLGVNKAYVSRMVHGIQIPPLRIRAKVGEFFEIDSCAIWRIPEIKTADELSDYLMSLGIKIGGKK